MSSNGAIATVFCLNFFLNRVRNSNARQAIFSMNANATSERQERYFKLIDRLLDCPNGQEPKILDEAPELLDAGFVSALMQAASYFAHQDNREAAKFLIFIARELSRQLGLYPQPQDAQPASP